MERQAIESSIVTHGTLIRLRAGIEAACKHVTIAVSSLKAGPLTVEASAGNRYFLSGLGIIERGALEHHRIDNSVITSAHVRLNE